MLDEPLTPAECALNVSQEIQRLGAGLDQAGARRAVLDPLAQLARMFADLSDLLNHPDAMATARTSPPRTADVLHLITLSDPEQAAAALAAVLRR